MNTYSIFLCQNVSSENNEGNVDTNKEICSTLIAKSQTDKTNKNAKKLIFVLFYFWSLSYKLKNTAKEKSLTFLYHMVYEAQTFS